MNRLNDMMVLDFCEWLNRKISNDYGQQEPDILDLLLNDGYNSRIMNYAEEYLMRSIHPIKSTLHRFIDSREFEDCMYRCEAKLHEKLHPQNIYGRQIRLSEILRQIAHECYYCDRCDNSFDQFISSLEQDTYHDNRIDPRTLLDNLRYSVNKGNNPKFCAYMNILNIDLSVEVDFLEWLINTQNKPIKISDMPLKLFEELVGNYQRSCSKEDTAKQKLIKAFKQSDSGTLLNRLRSILPYDTIKKAQNLGYITDRYSNRLIPYRCVILPLDARSNGYKEFIESWWYDLHYMSADFLDIYYSETDYGKSGYEIMNALSFIPSNLRGNLPCIVLWQDDMRKAKSINIGELDNDDIFKIFSKIVMLVQRDTSFETIVEEAEKMGAKCRKKNNPITSNILKIFGDNYGNAAANNPGSMKIAATYNYDSKQFNSEAEEAIRKIKEFSEINEQQKSMLIEIINDAKEAIRKNSNEGKEKSKTRFKDAMCFMGNASVKLLSALSALANLAKFFGI